MKTTRILFAVFISLAAAHAQHVSKPRSSIVNVDERRHELASGGDQRMRTAIIRLRSCADTMPVTPQLGKMVIPSYYLNGSDGPIDPTYGQVTRTYDRYERRVTDGMNRFLEGRSDIEAQCAQKQIDQWASADALDNFDYHTSLQALYQAEWTLSATAISESVILQSHSLDGAMVNRDIAWMLKIANRIKQADIDLHITNNHHYWHGLDAAVVGELAGDDSLFSWGVSVYQQAVNEINPDGSFRQEMLRKELATHYQAFALQPLIPLAEIALTQGIDLYPYRSPSGKTLADAVLFVVHADENPLIVTKYQTVAQKFNLHSDEAPLLCAEFEFYLHRFGATGPTDLWRLLPGPTAATHIGGNTTVLAGPLYVRNGTR